ncbi:MAG TPA: universal stress protein [Pseudolabrys sp.]|nr:universal stress protein [Pseudolabrys sp.]
MKTILIPAEDHDAMPAVLETARRIAEIFDSYIEGFAVRPSVADYVGVEPFSSLAMSVHDNDAAREIQAAFETFMREHHVPPAKSGPAVYSWGWPHASAVDDGFIGSYGRVFDLIVLGRPGREPQNPRMLPLEAALFDSGRPVLIVPGTAAPTIGRNILISWNGSTEQARTNAFAMPFLRRAEAVKVLTVEGGLTPGPTADEVVLELQRHGIAATAHTVKQGTRTVGEATLDFAAREGCDLLVKGAYTQSRLRQMIFGGATRHILAAATLPVLIAH